MKTLISYLLCFVIFFGFISTTFGQRDKQYYKVVINHEEQYSLTLANQKAPKGWKDTGIKGTQKKCQEYIKKVWTDMRPLSIRKSQVSSDTHYRVVINHEEQYSIWPENMPLPATWKTVGKARKLRACLAYIEEVWTDMRPLSLRKKLAK